ncbi:Peptidase family M28 [Seinonella peptonophila]|uniref:Peptidase family M28 n=1 Tax=Seinonella peptonophila TaxID=112248 RepID=A0A1M4U198_9BACL|nr:M20/M25/M40 family metallo-hydrolase [Seinonella peptonophila]SHE50518.1 Peptidase family M28 [Seinonella peptonophila]
MLKKLKYAVGSLAIASLLVVPNLSLAKNLPHQYGSTAYQHVYYLTEKIGTRVTGSAQEKNAGAYTSSQLIKLGLKPSTQSFSFVSTDQTISSQNIIATRTGKSKKQIIIGGHLDSVAAGKGADDNASSIGVILETLQRLKHQKTPYTLKFVFFGAEEKGLKGSQHYVSQMSEQEKQNTVAMINLDSLIAGDKMYVHGSKTIDPLRNFALKIAKQQHVKLEINPGKNPEYPAGTTGSWSDHASFQKIGIPILYFEATNWDIGELDGYTQTEKAGSIWHTTNDNLSYLQKEFPGRTQDHLAGFTKVLYKLILSIR